LRSACGVKHWLVLRRTRVIPSRFIVLATLAAAWLPAISAGSKDQNDNNSVQVGDQWTYGRKNEITGAPGDTYTVTVTEVTPKEIVTSVTFQGRDGSVINAFDHDWNTVANGVWRSTPHDGPGIRLPLEVGKEWRSEYFDINTLNSVKNKGSQITKVTGRETITTQAGTFDTFKIERQARSFNIAAPGSSAEIQVVLWYSPEINHWVRRTTLTKVQKRIRDNTSEELTAFSRKQ
jgi:hypothetical protein